MSGSSKLKEKVEKLERQLKDAEYEAEMYRTFYVACAQGGGRILPLALTHIQVIWGALKEISEFAVSNCKKECDSSCEECEFLKLQKLVLSCVKRLGKVQDEFKIELNNGC